MPETRWWTVEDDSVRCLLCPHTCLLSAGESGDCGARKAVPGALTIPGFGMITAEAPDPIEKKPLYHFHPGEMVWSVGFAGCNLHCPFCQNHNIARADPSIGRYSEAGEIVKHALLSGAGMLAYTYSEPTVHFEYLMECAEKASESGLKNILVTNGHLNSKPAAELLAKMDAVNIDLKSWDPDYYKQVLGGNLATVRRFIEIALDHCWVELTTLIVPGDNDNEEEVGDMCDWIASLSKDIPLHLSAYHPSYLYRKAATPVSIMETMYRIAAERLKFVYIGNLGCENDTLCPECRTPVIEREYYRTKSHITGRECPQCGTEIPGVFPVIPSRRTNQT